MTKIEDAHVDVLQLGIRWALVIYMELHASTDPGMFSKLTLKLLLLLIIEPASRPWGLEISIIQHCTADNRNLHGLVQLYKWSSIYTDDKLIVASRAAPQISKVHLHETRGCVEGQTETNKSTWYYFNLGAWKLKTICPTTVIDFIGLMAKGKENEEEASKF